MRRHKLLFLSLLVLYGLIFSQGQNCKEDLFPRRNEDNRLSGYVNLFGMWKINPVFTATYPFQGNVGKILQGLKYGAVNCEGRLVIKPVYDAIGDFIGGLAWVKKDEKWGLVDENGTVLLEPKYDEVQNVSRFNDFTWVRLDSLWGLYDKRKRAFVKDIQYPLYQILVDSTSLVKKGKYFGVISHNTGKYLVPPKMEHVKKVAPFTMSYMIEGKWGLVRDDGENILRPEYDSIALAGRYRLIIKKGGKYGVIDPKGKVIAPLKYDELTGYTEGAARFKRQGKYGFLSYYGKEAIPPIFEQASQFKNFRTIVKKEGKYGVIDRNQQYLIPSIYKSIRRANDNEFYVTVDDSNRYQLRNLYGDKITNLYFDTIYFDDNERRVRVKDEGGIGFYNTKQAAFCFDQRFDAATAFMDGFTIVKKGEQHGVVNEEGKEIVPVQFGEVKRLETAGNLYFEVLKNGEKGVFLNNGENIIPVTFESIQVSEGLFVVSNKNGHVGLYSSSGKILLPPEYYKIQKLISSKWIAIVEQEERAGLINERGDFLIELDKQQIDTIGGNLLKLRRGKHYYPYTMQGNLVVDEKYAAIGNYNESLLPVKMKKKWGYIDSRGKVKIEFQFDEADDFKDGKACVTFNGEKGFVNRRGEFSKGKCTN